MTKLCCRNLCWSFSRACALEKSSPNGLSGPVLKLVILYEQTDPTVNHLVELVPPVARKEEDSLAVLQSPEKHGHEIITYQVSFESLL